MEYQWKIKLVKLRKKSSSILLSSTIGISGNSKTYLKKGVNLCFKTCLILKAYKAFCKYNVKQTVTNKTVLKIYGHMCTRNL